VTYEEYQTFGALAGWKKCAACGRRLEARFQIRAVNQETYCWRTDCRQLSDKDWLDWWEAWDYFYGI
jgi:hypothetical protein